jgi:threonylcarbamoyladenosine tRNA methylthiotransferase MtaB
MQCTYCIIPSVRTELSSRPLGEVLDEIRRLVASGYREIVLTGIHLGHYGVGLDDGPGSAGPPNLAQLVRCAMQLDGRFRLRLSSLEAAEVTPELLALMAAHPDRICPHLHIPIQSGSDAVLRQMRRRMPSGRFAERCLAAAEVLDEPALSTDVIVGFPGETDADFQATCRVVEQVGFSKIHVFRFSPRAGTPAAEMPDQVGGAVKHRRAAELARIGERLRQQYAARLLGRRLQVLVESPVRDQPGMLVGTSGRYLPVEVPGARRLLGQLVSGRADRLIGDRIRAAITP